MDSPVDLSDAAAVIEWIYGRADELVAYVKCKTTLVDESSGERSLPGVEHRAPAGSVSTLMQIFFPEVQKVAVPLLTTPGDAYALDRRIFPWLPHASVHKHSLIGSLLTLVLLSLCTEDSCRAACPCRVSIMCWFNCVLYKAEKLGWTSLEMSSNVTVQNNEGFFQVLYEAFPDYLRSMCIDLSSKDERVRCRKLVDATHDDLLSDYLFARIAFKRCGGWLALVGPPSLREDPSFLADCLDFYWSSLSERRVDFLQHVELGLLAGVVLRTPRLLEFSCLQKKDLAARVLELDHRVSKQFKASLRELPEVAIACGVGYMRQNPSSLVPSLRELLPSALNALRDLRGPPGSKLRRAAVDLTEALSEGFSAEIEAACRRVQRLTGRDRTDEGRPSPARRAPSVGPPAVAVAPAFEGPSGEDPERDLERSIQASIEVANRIASEVRSARRGKGGMVSRTFAQRATAQAAQGGAEPDDAPPTPRPRRKERKVKPKLSDKERWQTEQFLKDCRPAIEAAKVAEEKVYEDVVPEIERRTKGLLVAARRQEKRSARLQRLFEARRRAQDLLLR